MSWPTTPQITFAVGELVTSGKMNTLRDALVQLTAKASFGVSGNPPATSAAGAWVMAGLGGTLTPKVSGLICVAGWARLQAAANGVAQLRYGPGNPPSPGVAAFGTTLGGTHSFGSALAGRIANQALEQQMWIDLSYQSTDGGSVDPVECELIAWEV